MSWKCACLAPGIAQGEIDARNRLNSNGLPDHGTRANRKCSQCHATASIQGHCSSPTGSPGIHACRTLTAPIDPATETWPSGRRRSPAKGVDGEPSRGFESLRLRQTSSFFQYFSALQRAVACFVACPDGACGDAHDPEPASLPRSPGRMRRVPRRPAPGMNGTASKTSRMPGSRGRPAVPRGRNGHARGLVTARSASARPVS